MTQDAPASAADTLLLGVSACLVGERVRYDGGHKREAVLCEEMQAGIRWIRVCPEVEAGLGVPRGPIRLESRNGAARLMGIESQQDWTAPMAAHSLARVEDLRRMGVVGYVLKSRSPTCGPGDAVLHRSDGVPLSHRAGAFAHVLAEQLPLLPVAAEPHLRQPAGREAFLAAASSYLALQRLSSGTSTLPALHRAFRYVVSARSPAVERELREARDAGAAEIYGALLMSTIQGEASSAGHHRVLLQLVDRLRGAVPPQISQRLNQAVEAYANADTTLYVVLTGVARAVETYEVAALIGDAYVFPGAARMRTYEAL